ncbi:hypothetical protein PUN28_004782 [Cardiocondyla obscurior]|uniref:Uncharacterized protein n=1 Tax=Cardiocondyla obscurior TaxID=286306 RepID=A0AAW2GEG0_9HYME
MFSLFCKSLTQIQRALTLTFTLFLEHVQFEFAYIEIAWIRCKNIQPIPTKLLSPRLHNMSLVLICCLLVATVISMRIRKSVRRYLENSAGRTNNCNNICYIKRLGSARHICATDVRFDDIYCEARTLINNNCCFDELLSQKKKPSPTKISRIMQTIKKMRKDLISIDFIYDPCAVNLSYNLPRTLAGNIQMSLSGNTADDAGLYFFATQASSLSTAVTLVFLVRVGFVRPVVF